MRKLLRPLTWLWRAGVALDRTRTTARRLPRPVVSIGNLAAGGTGKTPVTLWLAHQLHARGLKPAILTRGYRSGEEARIYESEGFSVGLGRDRYRAAQNITADVFLLDDGFQHWALARDVDLVCLDALNPWSGGLIPEGYAREGPSALARATAILHTRCDDAVTPPQLDLPQPQFRVRMVPSNAPSGQGPWSAFCGLGNPGSFQRTLAGLGIKPAHFRAFPDHHAYRDNELQSLAEHGSLLTTEKDCWNLPEAWRERVAVLKIRAEVERGGELMELVLQRIAR